VAVRTSPWRLRQRLALVVTVAAAAPSLAFGVWTVAWFWPFLSAGVSALLMTGWALLVGGLCTWYGHVAANHLVGPLDDLTRALRRFDPSLGYVDDPSLRDGRLDPEEMTSLKRALRSAVERVGRERAQKEAVLAGLMHDLKTPLVAQSMLLERLQGRPAPEQVQPIVSELLRSSRDTAGRLNRLIDVLRVDSAAIGLERRAVVVDTVVREVVATLRPLAEARGVRVEVLGSGSATIDRDSLARAVENVVANAVRYAHGSVVVEVFESLVRVSDDGPGFSAPFDELADPFRRGIASETTTLGTAGLGLYIARRSLEANGGRLKLETTGGGRTTLLLYLGVAAS
jgi:signal transduction histidine kinase